MGQNAVLILQDGKKFIGRSVGKKGKCVGEICCTTSMTGYQHTITDPSFANQIITFTFPHIGNVGINHIDSEGKKVLASGVIMRSLSEPSHSSSYISLNDWLEKNSVVGISDIDTRALTRYLRAHKSQNGMIDSYTTHNLFDHGVENTISCYTLQSINIMSTNNNYNKRIHHVQYKVIILNFGIKNSIIDRLVELNCAIELIQPDIGCATRILNMHPDGIVLSNGPGDPRELGKNITHEIEIMINSNIPIFGICMGHQLLAMTLGAQIVKMSIGHRGSNHPVYNKINNKIEITSQNHGFVVEETSIPNNIIITHISLFDKSIEGIMMKNYPVFSVQYHPEGGPGTHDSYYLFKLFIHNITLYKKNMLDLNQDIT
ncbi:glutamine-hydrolyzing carbamoyl-phosphate synthase small subunit [Wolbachia endosymbiont of Howardula sp.]|uniref:glutamine-hydrolyzing carbamoyl-phosphate synthase small subunit n=1 Tax=Wolbachia endosymbiont of Howardula sp. TaxID=2916816 RepID=UPI00217CD29B|nr:glutamine-hydrolyzing carbamoyl-phosphate synthase small subunit [Wolbachia endosymbiont of Howardula sp.]UWI83171.1 glutamine-hydrolyzing carbamoyl-phosphate synthase small subunit [Wolbachia endosymbiont of Howardula sp.]